MKEEGSDVTSSDGQVAPGKKKQSNARKETANKIERVDEDLMFHMQSIIINHQYVCLCERVAVSSSPSCLYIFPNAIRKEGTL